MRVKPQYTFVIQPYVLSHIVTELQLISTTYTLSYFFHFINVAYSDIQNYHDIKQHSVIFHCIYSHINMAFIFNYEKITITVFSDR
jgi:hypothetical protein